MPKATQAPAMTVEYRLVGKLVVDENNARHLSQGADLNPFLLSSVAAEGIKQPLVVRPAKGGKFSVIDGSQRLAAAKSAGLKQVPTVLYDEGTSLTSVALNLSVKQMDMYERYEGYRQAVAAGVSEDRIKTVLGLDDHSKKMIAAIAKIEPSIYEQLRTNRCGERLFRAIARIPAHAQVALWNEVLASQEVAGHFSEWRAQEVVNAYFKTPTNMTKAQVATVLPYYEANGGRVERALFGDGDSEPPVRILDPDMLPQAAADYMKHAADELSQLRGRSVVTLPPATSYVALIHEIREHGYMIDPATRQVTAEQQEAAATAVGFSSYDAYRDWCEQVEYGEVSEEAAEAKFDAFDYTLADAAAQHDAVYLIRLNIDGGLEKVFPCVPLAEEQTRPTTGDAGNDKDTGPDLTAAAKSRHQAMFAALIQQQMVVSDGFGMRWAAYSIYEAAYGFAKMTGMHHLAIARDNWNEGKTLDGYVADPQQTALFDSLFAHRFTMADFVDMERHDCMDVMIKSLIVLQARSRPESNFNDILTVFGIDPREAWDALVPTQELAEAWFNQFKKPQLVEYAIDTLDPETVGIGKIANNLKKSELVASLAKALTKGAPGQPEAVQDRAKYAMPLGLEWLAEAEATNDGADEAGAEAAE